ncbi:GATA zinc finger domain-containing protein 14-like [Onthophagus taurus]|uniref:GATA zinc finger domain-containing protein 14-like n=1 Tax=Onthophagus taurus TaxID=166361 RepID=UPI0039BE0DB5
MFNRCKFVEGLDESTITKDLLNHFVLSDNQLLVCQNITEMTQLIEILRRLDDFSKQQRRKNNIYNKPNLRNENHYSNQHGNGNNNNKTTNLNNNNKNNYHNYNNYNKNNYRNHNNENNYNYNYKNENHNGNGNNFSRGNRDNEHYNRNYQPNTYRPQNYPRVGFQPRGQTNFNQGRNSFGPDERTPNNTNINVINTRRQEYDRWNKEEVTIAEIHDHGQNEKKNVKLTNELQTILKEPENKIQCINQFNLNNPKKFYDNPHNFLNFPDEEEMLYNLIPKIEIRIRNLTIKAIIDTAAEISLINKDMASKIENLENILEKIKKIDLITANKKKMGQIGEKIFVNLIIKDKAYLMEFYIFEGMTHDCLIGILKKII